MIVYALLFFIPAILGMAEQNGEAKRQHLNFAWLLAAVLVALIVGFRWKTGADWGNYYSDLSRISAESFSLSVHRDIGYGLVAWLATRITDPGMIVVTGFGGFLMGFALARFSLDQPRPWLALTICVPYLILVLGMGYMRQGMAVSILLFAFVELRKGNIWRYVILTLIAGTFHATAIILLPVVALVATRNRALVYGASAVIGIVAFSILLSTRTDAFMYDYVDQGQDSSGALVRLLMNAVAAAVLLVFRKDFIMTTYERKLWTSMSFLSLGLLGLFFLFPSSTAVDRIGLYALPLQVFVGSRIPDALGAKDFQFRRLLAMLIILLYGIAYFVWFFYASHAYIWLPYRSWFFEDGLCYECEMMYF